MTDESLYPISAAEHLVESFLACRLPKGEFTHEAHLMAGLYVLAKHGPDALPVMREHLIAYLASIGAESTDTSGYHETMTVYWMDQLKNRLAETKGSVTWNQETLDRLLEDECLADRNSWTAHYTKELMGSKEARRGYVKPDIVQQASEMA